MCLNDTRTIEFCMSVNRSCPFSFFLFRTCVFSSAAKTKVQDFGSTVYGYAETYYEDNIQPLTDGYTQWVSSVKSTVLEKIQHTVGNYIPIRANASDSAGQQ